MEDVVPCGGEVVGVGERVHGRKGVVKDGMVARGDFACADVEDEGNQGRMEFGETHEHAEAGSGVPLGDGLAISDVIVKDVDGAAEDVGTGKVGMGVAIACPQFDGRNAGSDTGKAIEDPDCVLDGEGP